MQSIIEVEGLRKSYRRLRGAPRVALDGLELAVPDGGVFGLLGPNGSGKTTTIRCVLGLARPSAGAVRVLGRTLPDGLPEVLARTGAIVEFPALFPTMTGRENLRLLGAMAGLGHRRVDEVLEQVGLAARRPEAAETAARLAPGAKAMVLADAAGAGGDFEVVVNATPLGMAGEPPPLDPLRLGPDQCVVDLVYHPAETPLLVAARARGARTQNGLPMLVHQAARSFSIWTGVEAPVAVLLAAAQAALRG